ncbi:MAG: Type-1 restriction enzyme MjaXIP specificity protein [Candidatus Methanogaster sp.]|nr:MAG: Type-1 restriction enzyme MjaXIP specificity protein [ANME-2 cluster archaeon]
MLLETRGAHERRWKQHPAYRDSGVEWLGEVPEGWAVLRLKNVTHFGYGNSLAADDRVPGEYRVYGSNGIVGWHEQPNTKGPCLIIGRKGSFGKVVYSEKSCFAIDTTYFVDSKHTDNNLRWLYYCLQWLQLDSFTKDSAVPGLSREDAYENRVPFCSIDEQHAIATFLDHETGRIDALIVKKERQIDLLQEKRAALISHAVTKGLDPDAPMKDSGVEWLGGVPEHWAKMGIKHLLHQIIDTEHKTAPYSPDGRYLVVRTANVRNGILSFDDAKYTDNEGFKEWTQRGVPKPGDILFTREAPAGDACIVPDNVPLCIGQRMVLFRVNKQRLDARFGIYSIYGGLADEFIRSLSQGSTVGHFNMSDIGNTPLFEPSLSEQRTIAAFLDRETGHIDTLTTKVRESISKLREYRTALISAAVTGKIDVREELVS